MIKCRGSPTKTKLTMQFVINTDKSHNSDEFRMHEYNLALYRMHKVPPSSQ